MCQLNLTFGMCNIYCMRTDPLSAIPYIALKHLSMSFQADLHPGDAQKPERGFRRNFLWKSLGQLSL